MSTGGGRATKAGDADLQAGDGSRPRWATCLDSLATAGGQALTAAASSLDPPHCRATLGRLLATFRDRYSEQLDALWSALGRLVVTHERIAPLIARDADARVARLVQSAAFAAALADTRADNESEHLVFPILARVLPDVTRPRPAATIAALTHDNPSIRREKPGAPLTAQRTGARFITCWPADYTPIRITEARVVRPQPSLQIFSLTLEVPEGITFRAGLGEAIRFYVAAPFALDFIYALRGTRGTATALDESGKKLLEVPLRDAVRWVRVDTDEPPLVDASSRAFASTPLLSDLMVMPESFAFFDLVTSALRGVPEKARRLIVTIELAHVEPAVEAIQASDLHLGCTPAVNVFEAVMERSLMPSERAIVLHAPANPLAEVLDVVRVTCVDTRFAESTIPLYEKASPGDVLLGGVFARLRRSPSVTADRVDVEMSFFSMDRASEPAPTSQLRCEFIATERHACMDLARGDVRGIDVANISRVVRGVPVEWGREIPWRHNAYARMPCSELGGRASAVEAFLSIHHPVMSGANGERPRVVTAERVRGERLEGGAIQHGLHFTVEIDLHAFAGPGIAWLTGELVARALAERDDWLRYSRLRWGPHGALYDFGPRQGRLLPAVLA